MNEDIHPSIKLVMRECEEAIDHELGWKTFCRSVLSRLELENAILPVEKQFDLEKWKKKKQ